MAARVPTFLNGYLGKMKLGIAAATGTSSDSSQDRIVVAVVNTSRSPDVRTEGTLTYGNT